MNRLQKKRRRIATKQAMRKAKLEPRPVSDDVLAQVLSRALLYSEWSYCDVYDAHYDSANRWTEGTCGDSSCEYCATRPEVHPINCPCLKG